MIGAIKKYWWLILLRGILVFIFGLLCVFITDMVMYTLLMYFGILSVLTGIILLIETALNRNEPIAVKVTEGIFYILAGMLFLYRPDFVLRLTFYLIAFWSIIAGLFIIYRAFHLRKFIQNERLHILNGIITVLFGLMILFNAFATAEAVIFVFGIFTIISGLFMIAVSFKIRSAAQKTAVSFWSDLLFLTKNFRNIPKIQIRNLRRHIRKYFIKNILILNVNKLLFLLTITIIMLYLEKLI